MKIEVDLLVNGSYSRLGVFCIRTRFSSGSNSYG